MAWSSNGRHVASGSGDGSLKIWEAASGRELHTLRGDHGSVRCVVFSPDGKQLAAGSNDGTIQVLEDLEDLKRVRAFAADGTAIMALAWSPDGRLLASGGIDGTIKIWNVSDRRAILNLRATSGWLSSLAWSPDATQLASTSGHEIKTWNVTDGREIATMRGHTDAATGVSWSPDGLRLASTGSDHSVRIWDPKTGEETLLIPSHASTAFCGVAWSPDGLRLARAGLEVVRIWDATLGYERDRSPKALPFLDRKIAGGAAVAEAIRFRSAILAQQGESDRAAADWDRMVQLDPESRNPLLATGWWIAGPLAASDRPEGEPATAPDPKLPFSDPNALGTSLSWRQASFSTDGVIDFDEPLPREQATLGFLRVYSPIGQAVSATFRAPGDLLVWLNGRPADVSDRASSMKYRSDRSPLILRKGWNTLWVRVVRGEGRHRLSVRLSNAPEDWASALIDRGRSEEAFRLVRESLESTPDDPTLLRTAARLHRHRGEELRRAQTIERGGR